LAVRQPYRPILYLLEDLMLHALGKQFGQDWLECDGAVAARVRSDSPGLLDKDCDTGLGLLTDGLGAGSVDSICKGLSGGGIV